MKVLGIETATRAGGSALFDDNGLVAEAFSDTETTHSRRLLPSIDRLITEAGWKPRDIDLVAVSTGPGSFTGLRIGMAAGAEIVGVPTLDAFAFNIAKAGMGLPIWPVLDARKAEVFTAPFDPNGRRLGPDENVTPEMLSQLIAGDEKIVIAGDGIRKYDRLLAETGARALRPPGEFDDPRPAAVAELGFVMFRAGTRHDPDNVSPSYVRAPDAIINPRSAKGPPRI